MKGLIPTEKKKSPGKKQETVERKALKEESSRRSWKNKVQKGNGRTINHWEEEKSRKGVGNSRKETTERRKFHEGVGKVQCRKEKKCKDY